MRSRGTHTSITVIIPVMIFYVTVLGGAGYFIYTHRQTEIQYPQLKSETHVQGGTLYDPAGRQMELNALIWEGTLMFPTNVTPSMRAEETEVNLLIENPPDNGNRSAVTINREDTEEGIYKPGYLDLEQYIEEAPLNVGSPVGEYLCVTNFDAHRISNNAYIGRASTRITLCVQD